MVDDFEPWHPFVGSLLQSEPSLEIVGHAFDGSEAVQKAQKLQPDLILLDIGLPGLHGLEAARQMRQHSQNATILFCSEHHSPEIAEAALETGALGYVVKRDAARELLPAVRAVLQGRHFVSSRFGSHKFVTTALGRELAHVVEFYTHDSVLLDELAAMFRASLAAGDSVVAIMTSSHRSGLEQRLMEQGVDVREAIKNDWLLLFDTDQILGECMDTVGLSRERCLSHFGNILRTAEAAARGQHKRVVVFGETVAVLWAQEKYDAAIQLEELWNELAPTCNFHLCCAYPASAFREGVGKERYATLCAQHSQVVSTFDAFASHRITVGDPSGKGTPHCAAP